MKPVYPPCLRHHTLHQTGCFLLVSTPTSEKTVFANSRQNVKKVQEKETDGQTSVVGLRISPYGTPSLVTVMYDLDTVLDLYLETTKFCES